MKQVAMLVVTLTVAGCSTKSASEYTTSKLRAEVGVVATGDGSAAVSVSFMDAEKLMTFVQLTTDDKVGAIVGSDTRTMKETSLLGAVTYSANFNQDAGDTAFRVRLTRKLDSGAPDSSGTLPKPFTVQALGKSTYSRAEAVPVSWTSSPSGDAMVLEAAGSCLNTYRAELGTGASSHAIPAGSLKKREPGSATETVPDECDVTVTVSRSRQGKVDPAFKGGSFTARQVRTAKFHSAP